MSFFKKVVLLFLLLQSCAVSARVRKSSAPYISGDTFRSVCDFLYDETDQSFDPRNVTPGSVIFVKTDMLEAFFKDKHREIAQPYIIVSHNSDDNVTARFAQYLNDPKIIKWFAQNVEEFSHPKLQPIPIGIANQYISQGSVSALTNAIEVNKKRRKKHLCYLNIKAVHYPQERDQIMNLFHRKPYVFSSSKVNFDTYLQHVASSKFVFSPRGAGLDTHRTWEALYMGSYPVVRTSAIDSLYDDLPVLIVEDWKKLNEKKLKKAYSKFSRKNIEWKKSIFLTGWIRSINADQST